MKRQDDSSERKFNNGEWTQARFNSFVKSALRAASRRWPPKFETLNESYVDVRINEKTGRKAKHFRCNCCKRLFPSADVQVDHINPIINPDVGFTNWDDVINNMFCEKEKLQVLCKPCHSLKTNEERKISIERKRLGEVRDDRAGAESSPQIETMAPPKSRKTEKSEP